MTRKVRQRLDTEVMTKESRLSLGYPKERTPGDPASQVRVYSIAGFVSRGPGLLHPVDPGVSAAGR